MRKGLEVHQETKENIFKTLGRKIDGGEGCNGGSGYIRQERMERIREQYERALGEVKDFMRDTRDRTKDMDSINIRGRETS